MNYWPRGYWPRNYWPRRYWLRAGAEAIFVRVADAVKAKARQLLSRPAQEAGVRPAGQATMIREAQHGVDRPEQ